MMLFKLSISSMKKLRKDYLVLLFGLTISIAIFYMFETLAQNKVFIEANSMISAIVFVFHIGTFILGVITVFYIFYATSFILSIRQKEMGMYLTLGAKKRKVSQMMFLETFAIGIISLIAGILIGVGLAKAVAMLFTWQLDFSAKGFEPFYMSSIITTVVFYIILFFLTASTNAFQIARKPVLALLHADRKQDNVYGKGIWTFIGVILSVALIGFGYWAMVHMEKLGQFGVIVAAITITLGTYLFFIAFLPFFIKRMKGIRSLNEKGINSFTLAQLRFRIQQLTKVLGTVAMLIALGLGAMTAGLAFYHNIEKQVDMFFINDATVYQPDEKDEKLLSTMDIKEKNAYHYKITDKKVYFLKDDLMAHPPLTMVFDPGTMKYPKSQRVDTKLPKAIYAANEEKSVTPLPKKWLDALQQMNAGPEMFGSRTIYVVDGAKYDNITAKSKQVLLIRTNGYEPYLSQFKQLDSRQIKLASDYRGEKVDSVNDKYAGYVGFKAISSGTIFMGLFLGVAFLMMMASVLMFKLLSSASSDIGRYQMLRKIGVRTATLSKSIYREVFLVFLFPAIIGLFHVLIGMKMFGFILIDPYAKIWIPISIFLIIYGVYYWLTVTMYKSIVLPKEK
ncbi:FtsX-like permease family protein [Virgibacillus halophilus]|uniref:FtsX-like permease family protein n=1 Tax=Tigheibacillus halophilus TaxID=361280 RepID=A0ABU5C4U0_9BACI|nr:FtsX-like permease family protein [Virgibacillus halophilus]